MDEAGRLFEAGEFFVPELLVSARAMKAAMAVLEPALADQPRASAGRIAIGTVAGDLHDIGKNLVATMLRGAGFEVDDLGVDVTPGQFVEAARAGADVIGISSLLTTTMISMRAVVQALEEAGLRDRVKVMVGGAPVTPAVRRRHRGRRLQRQRRRRRDARPAAGRHGEAVMTSRERVLAAMRHQRPDRTPFDFSWGFAPAQLHRFQDATGAVDPEDYFGADTRLLRPSPTRLADGLLPLPRRAAAGRAGRRVGHRPPPERQHRRGARAPRRVHLPAARRVRASGDALDYPLPDLDADYRYEDFAARVAARPGARASPRWR